MGKDNGGAQTTTTRPPAELLGPIFGTGGIPTTNQFNTEIYTSRDLTGLDNQIAELQAKMATAPRYSRSKPSQGMYQKQLEPLLAQREAVMRSIAAGPQNQPAGPNGETITPFQGFIPELIGKYERGEFGQTPSDYTKQAITQTADASNFSNPLLDPALESAQNFIKGGAENPYLQQQIDSQLNRITNKVVNSTQSDFNRAGRFGSPSQDNVIAQTVTESASPFITQLLGEDYARRQQQQADFTRLAPILGTAKQEEKLKNAQTLAAAGSAQESSQLNKFDELSRLATLLGVPNIFGSQTSVPLTRNSTSGALGALSTGLGILSLFNPATAPLAAASGAINYAGGAR